MVAGFERKGHAKGDIPGVRSKVIAVEGFWLRALYIGKVEKKWLKKSQLLYLDMVFLTI